MVLFCVFFLGVLGQGKTNVIFLSEYNGPIQLDTTGFVKKTGVLYQYFFRIRNDFSRDTVFYLRNKDNGITTLSITDSAGTIISTQKTGNQLPINQRFGQDDEGFLPIAIKKNTTIGIQLSLEGFQGTAPSLYCSIFSPEAYYRFYKENESTIRTQQFMVVFFIGAMLLMFLFFWFMYIKSRQALYGRYALYLSFQLVYGCLRLGPVTLIGYVIAQHPALQSSLIPPIILTAVGGYAWFLNELLDLRKLRPILHRHIKWLAIGVWCYSFINWLVYFSMPQLPLQTLSFQLIRLLLVAINIYILLTVAVFVKSTIKKYYLIGNSLFLVFGVLAAVKEINNVFNGTYFSKLNNANWYMVGILLECIFFAFAMGIRMKEMRQEKDRVNRKLIEQMKLNEQLMLEDNLKLEQKILERSRQMQQQAKEMEEVKIQETRASYEKQISETRMLALRSRMNPHFLFNSLNSIKYFILKNDNDTAAFYLNKFSRLLRMILDYTSHETITLQQELDALGLYLDIESLRFDQSFHYHIKVDENVAPQNISIPPLLLQPFVENAIWHGLANSEMMDKKCMIEIKKTNGHVLIQIMDNGVGREAAAVYKENKMNRMDSFGMKITDERIELFNLVNGGKLSVAIKDNKDPDNNPTGTTVDILIET